MVETNDEYLSTSGFGDGSRYERGRPGYPDEALAMFGRTFELGPGKRVIDLGAGTGKFTRQLALSGVEILAVEPSPSMRAELARNLPEVELVDGSAESIPAPDASVDAVFVAQAFHWFDPDRALTEMARVLRPGGGLGLIWNERDETVEWVSTLSRAIEWPERGPYRVGKDFRPVVSAHPAFVDVDRHRYQFHQILDHAGLMDRMASTSYITAMEPDQREAFLVPLAELVSRLPEPVVLPYVTNAYTARRI
ncbi:MAG TPA: methyltransferase domain-containing protein [Acidimicrobiales bacterium]|jgi:SAM-dependent methyltransferase|nr:methyltransferase domain-containing protein [Acidimicrobiales bacterium]